MNEKPKSQGESPTGYSIDATIGARSKNILVGKDSNQDIHDQKQNNTTNLYFSLQDYLDRDPEKHTKGDLPMEVEREFRRNFTELTVALKAVVITVDNLAKELSTTSTNVNNLSSEMSQNSKATIQSIDLIRQQLAATQSLIDNYQEMTERTIAGLKLPPDEQIKQAAIARVKTEVKMQVILTASIWIFFLYVAADRLGLIGK